MEGLIELGHHIVCHSLCGGTRYSDLLYLVVGSDTIWGTSWCLTLYVVGPCILALLDVGHLLWQKW